MFDISDLPRPVIRYGVGLWRRRWLVVAAAWAFALLGWFAVWLIPDKYESRAQVFVQTETILEPVLNGVIARPNYEQRVEVMRLQLLTRPNVEEIVRRAGLDKTIEARTELARRAKMEKLVDWVAGEIHIESPREMYFVISYKNGDPAMARRVVDAVLNLLIEQDLGASLAEKEEARRRLDQRIAEFDARLTAKEREEAEFRRAHASELAASQSNLRRREMKEGELRRAEDELAQARRRLATLENLLAQTSRTSSGDELDTLKVRLAQLRSQYNENYPDIQDLEARIAQLETAGRATLPTNPEYTRIQADMRAVKDKIAGLEERRERLNGELQTLDLAISATPGAEAELQRIVRDYEQTRKTYDELAARRDRLALTSALGAGGQGVEYMIFERPAEALSPSDPPRLLLILGVFALAFAGGGGVAFLLTYLARTYAQSTDLEDAFDLPVLGAFSEAKSMVVSGVRRAEMVKLAGACAGLAVATLGLAYFEALRITDHGNAETQIAELGKAGDVR
ncbi:MAG: XrtA system polysaccharide chain length determinant [Parvularculaceae bacterium]